MPSASVPSLLICVLADEGHHLHETIGSITVQAITPAQVIICQPTYSHGNTTPAEAVWFLGQLYSLFTVNGQPLSPTQVKTAETLLILKAGDILKEGYLESCLSVLARQPELSFVGCWHRSTHNDHLDTFPFDAAPELLPLYGPRWFNRAVMRTEAQQLLIDLFDPRLAELGEIGYLWELEDQRGPGVLIPAALIERAAAPAPSPNPNLISYLILRDASPTRQKRLARYLVSHLAENGLKPGRRHIPSHRSFNRRVSGYESHSRLASYGKILDLAGASQGNFHQTIMNRLLGDIKEPC